MKRTLLFCTVAFLSCATFADVVPLRPYEIEYDNYLQEWKVTHPDDPKGYLSYDEKGYLSYDEWIKSWRSPGDEPMPDEPISPLIPTTTEHVAPDFTPTVPNITGTIPDNPAVVLRNMINIDPGLKIKALDTPVVDPTTPTTPGHVAPDFAPTVPHATEPKKLAAYVDGPDTPVDEPTTPGHVAPDFTPTVPHITAPNTPTVPNVPDDPRDLATYGFDGRGNVGRTPVSTLSPVSTHVAPDFTPSYTSDSLSGISGTHKADDLISDFKDTHSDFNNIGATGKSVLQPISFNPTVENSATVSGSDSSKVDSAGSEVKTVPDAKAKTKTATKTGLKSARKKKKK